LKTLTAKIALATLAALGVAAQAQAASVSALLERSSVPAQLPDGGAYLQVTISDGVAGAIDFRVDTLEDVQDYQGFSEPLGISAFSFNLGNSGAGSNNIVGPNGWTVAGIPQQFFPQAFMRARPRNMDASENSLFARFHQRFNNESDDGDQFRPHFRHQRGSLMGKMLAQKIRSVRNIRSVSAQVVPGTDIGLFGEFDINLVRDSGDSQDPLEFSIVGVDGDTPEDYISTLSTGDAARGNALFAAQVTGLDIVISRNEEPGDSINTAAFGGSNVVPLPPAMTFMFSATALLGALGVRRRKIKDAA